MNNRKLINIVKGDIQNAINNGEYTRNTERNSNIEFDTKNKLILLDGVPYSNPLLVETTYNELKTLRDNSQLVPGSFYRITDYECTTTLENTQSAGHKFDIVLLALSEDSLLEEGWAIRNESNLYDVTFSDNVTKKCWIYFDGSHYNIVDDKTQLGDNSLSSGDITLDFSAKTASCPTLSSTSLTTENLSYNNDYFKNSNLNAWKVWYCLDNDTNRFAWADDSIDESIEETITYRDYMVRTIPRNSSLDKVQDGTQYYGWGTGLYTKTLDIVIGETQVWNSVGTMVNVVEAHTPGHEGTNLPNGRGVIYRLIDEFNNDVAYDFKNILFKRYKITSIAVNSTEIVDDFIYDEEYSPYHLGVDNPWKPEDMQIDTNDPIFTYTFTGVCTSNGYIQHYDLTVNLPIIPQSAIEQIQLNLYSQLLKDMCRNNKVETYYGQEDDIHDADNLLKMFLSDNVFYGYMRFGFDGETYSTLVAKIYDNSIETSSKGNTIGGYTPTIKNRISRKSNFNLISGENNILDNSYGSIICGNVNKLEGTQNCYVVGYYNNIHGGYRILLLNNASSNTVGVNSNSITLLGGERNIFGMRNQSITLTNPENVVCGNQVSYITHTCKAISNVKIEGDCQYITIAASLGTDKYVSNIIIGKGVKGTSSSVKTITHNNLNNSTQTTYLPSNSSTVNV